MRALENTPTAFRDTVNRAVDVELTGNLSFRQMMDAEAAAISQTTRVAAAGNRRRAVTVMTPEETTAAQGLAGLRGDKNPPEAEILQE